MQQQRPKRIPGMLAAALLATETSARRIAPAGATAAGAVVRASAPVMQQQQQQAATSDAQKVIKREVRRKIMGEERYKRGGAPFDNAIHKDVAGKMSEKFKSELLEEIKAGELRRITKGEGNSAVTFVLAQEYGFCWGVERSIELAWAARDAYPEKKLHITNELIHNPGVNEMLGDMDVAFIEKLDGGGKAFETIEDGDVVILPAFGASLEEMELLDKRGVTVVDTTCPWVSKVWTTVDKHQRAEMTSLIHGKWAHEAVATASMCETYLIVKDIDEAAYVASYILGEEGAPTTDELMAKFKNAMSPHFDPKAPQEDRPRQPDDHVQEGDAGDRQALREDDDAGVRRGERQGALRRLRHHLRRHAGPPGRHHGDDHSALAGELDLILVVGGWDSSNTAHLLEIPDHAGLTAYHVNEPGCIKPTNAIGTAPSTARSSSRRTSSRSTAPSRSASPRARRRPIRSCRSARGDPPHQEAAVGRGVRSRGGRAQRGARGAGRARGGVRCDRQGGGRAGHGGAVGGTALRSCACGAEGKARMMRERCGAARAPQGGERRSGRLGWDGGGAARRDW